MKVVFGSTDGDHYPSFSFWFEGPGSATCRASCEHCFLHTSKTSPTPLETCFEQYNDLVARSYVVIPKTPDTFSRDGKYLRMGILNDNHLYAQEGIKHCGVAWTNGLPLLLGDGHQLLSLARDNNLNIISFSGYALHGLVKGAAPPSITEAAIQLVKDWNGQQPPERRFQTSLTFTISQFNRDADSVRGYIEYCRKLNIDYIRLNRFIDCTRDGKFRNLIISDEETAQFFADIVPVLESYDSPKVMISNDFGFSGIEAIGGHKGLNDCAGGTGSFAIFNSLVYPCEEVLTRPIGELVHKTDGGGWDIHIEPGALEALAEAKQHPAYSGCIAHLFSSMEIAIPSSV